MLQLECVALHHRVMGRLDEGVGAAQEIFTNLRRKWPRYRWKQQIRLIGRGVAQGEGFARSAKRLTLGVETAVPRRTLAPPGSVDDGLTRVGAQEKFNRGAKSVWLAGKTSPFGNAGVPS